MTIQLDPTASASTSAHEPLVLIAGADAAEYLVTLDGAPRVLAVAVIRVEDGGTFCYPHAPALPRLGPFASPMEALDACREAQRAAQCFDPCCHPGN